MESLNCQHYVVNIKTNEVIVYTKSPARMNGLCPFLSERPPKKPGEYFWREKKSQKPHRHINLMHQVHGQNIGRRGTTITTPVTVTTILKIVLQTPFFVGKG